MINYKFHWLDANSGPTLGHAKLTSKIEGSDLEIMMYCKSYANKMASTHHFILDYNKDGEYSNFYSGDIGRQNIKVLQSLGELPKKVTNLKDYEDAILKCRKQFVNQSFPVWAEQKPLKWIVTIFCGVVFVTTERCEPVGPVKTTMLGYIHYQFIKDKLLGKTHGDILRKQDGILTKKGAFDALSR